jgi:endonuclease/exonuclease/phosphatase family metal-dependent hydrolase
MRRFLLVVFGLFAAVMLLAGAQHLRNSGGPELAPPAPGALRLATWNVHYIAARRTEGRWGLARWEARKAPLAAGFAALRADLVAFQEMETFRGGNDDSENLAREWLLENAPGHAAAAVGDWRSFPSTQPIFYRTERLEPLDQGWFFFSPTPEAIYSRSFDGSYPAFASWARFRDRRGARAEFRVLNLHLDYASGENRRRSVELVVERARPWIEAGETVLLAGDLNALLGSPLHRALGDAGFTFLPVRGATFHFDRGINLFGAIDHLAYAGDARPASEPVVMRRKRGPVWASDHYPVVADFHLDAP